MSKKLSLIGVLCITLMAMSGNHAIAWFIPQPPGISGWGCCTEVTITVDIAGGGPIDPETGRPKDEETALKVEIQLLEAYVIMFNPTHLKKGSEKLVLYGVGGSHPAKTIPTPLTEAYPNERGQFEIDTIVPISVDKCHSRDESGELLYPLCETPEGYPEDTSDYLTAEEDRAARFLFYWNIIRAETPADVAEQYFDIVKGGGWYPTWLRIILARVGADLEGKFAKGGPAQVFVATDEDERALEWPDPADPWPDLDDSAPLVPLVNYEIRLEGEPFAFYDHQDVLAGSTLSVNARKGVLSNDFDVRVVEGEDGFEVLEGDPLEVIEVGPTDDTNPSLVGVSFLTANDGTVTLNADGSFTYTAPVDGDPPVEDDYVWYKNGEISGPNESNVTVLHFGIIN